MNKEIKTIFMTLAAWEAWKTALLSGGYRQGKDKLVDKGCYCCLGVLEHVLSGEVEDRGVPSTSWLKDNAVKFTNIHGSVTDVPFVFGNLYGSEDYHLISEMNDAGYSFEGIVALMEPHVQFTDEIQDTPL